MTGFPLSRISQIAYMVEDLDVAIERWATKLQVGPFFVRPHIQYPELTYRGRPSSPDISAAFAFAGDVQIELIQLHNDAPSVFRDFIRNTGYGLQHVGVLCADIPAATKTLSARGIEVLQRGVNAAGIETVFYDTEFHPGAMLELIADTPVVRASFAAMREAAQTWDGQAARH